MSDDDDVKDSQKWTGNKGAEMRQALSELAETNQIVLMVVIRGEGGHVGLKVQILMEPSWDVVEMLERTTAAYRRVLSGEEPDEPPKGWYCQRCEGWFQKGGNCPRCGPPLRRVSAAVK